VPFFFKGAMKLKIKDNKYIIPNPYMHHNKTDITICIPRVDSSISKQEIFTKICALRVGFIEKIIEIPLKNDETGKRVIIKFKTWVENELSKRILSRFEENKDIKIVYNDPWYWIAYKIISKNT
jgi:hypothetical protein